MIPKNLLAFIFCTFVTLVWVINFDISPKFNGINARANPFYFLRWYHSIFIAFYVKIFRTDFEQIEIIMF